MDWKINGQTFAAQDLSVVSLEISNMATDIMTFTASRSVTDSSIFVYDQPVRVTRDGLPFFSGRCDRIPIIGNDQQESHTYKILGPWDQLERLTFMQRWKEGHWEGDQWETDWIYKSRAVLGQGENGNSVSIGAVIKSVIEYAITCGVPISTGTIDAGPLIPWDEIVDLSCANVIRRMAKWIPGAVGYFDYSVEKPSFNFKTRTSMTPLTVTVGDNVVSANLTAVGSRSVPAVVLLYEQSVEVDGASMLYTPRDVYPPNATGREIGSIVQTIQLSAWSANTTTQKQTVHCRFVPDFSFDPDAFKAWFLRHHPEWASQAIPTGFDTLRFSNVTIDSVTRTSSFNYELVEGTIQDWMRKYILDGNGEKILNPNNKYSFEDEEDVIRTTISYQMLSGNGEVIREVEGQVIITKILATNCPPDTYKNVTSSISPGDQMIPGLAKEIYDNLNAKHFMGSVTIAALEVPGVTWLGHNLLVAGGRDTWMTMSAVIQSIQAKIDEGVTVIQVGPPGHLSTDDLISLRRANGVRKNCLDSGARLTGKSTGNSVELGSAIPKGYGSSSPGSWGSFVYLLSSLSAAGDDLTFEKTGVHVNMVGGTTSESIPLTTVQVVSDARVYDDKIMIKTRSIKVFEAGPESDWITIATGEPCS